MFFVVAIHELPLPGTGSVSASDAETAQAQADGLRPETDF